MQIFAYFSIYLPETSSKYFQNECICLMLELSCFCPVPPRSTVPCFCDVKNIAKNYFDVHTMENPSMDWVWNRFGPLVTSWHSWKTPAIFSSLRGVVAVNTGLGENSLQFVCYPKLQKLAKFKKGRKKHG